MKKMKKKNNEIVDYDNNDTTAFIDKTKSKSLNDLGYKLPKETPTKVISLRLPTKLLNAIRAYSSQRDLPYQSVIKLFLQEEAEKYKLV
jgi:predicted DNA binding CopG/RHH family protein